MLLWQIGSIHREIDVSDLKSSSFNAELRDRQLWRGIDASGVGLWELNVATQEMSWSSATRRLFGVADDSAVDYDLFLSLLEPLDRQRTEDAVRSSIQTGCAFDVQYRVRQKAGEGHWVREHAAARIETKTGSFGT